MEKANAMRLAWKIFKLRGNHHKYPFGECLKHAWGTIKSATLAPKKESKPATVVYRDSVTFLINRTNSPAYSWEIDKSKLKVVNLQAYEDLSLDEGMVMARGIKETSKYSDSRGYKNSSIYKAYQETRGVKTFLSRTNTQILLRKAEGKTSTKTFARRFGDSGTYSE